MSLRYHATGLQTGRLVEFYEDVKNGKYEVKHYVVEGKPDVYKFDWIGAAYKKYNDLAAI